jgi:hypothetical protein
MPIGQPSSYGRTSSDLDRSPHLYFVNSHPYNGLPPCTGKTYKVSIYGPTAEADYCDAVGRRGVSIPKIAVSNVVALPTLPASPSRRPNVEFPLTAPVALTGNPSTFYFLTLEGTGGVTQLPVQGAMAVCGDDVTQPGMNTHACSAHRLFSANRVFDLCP